MNTNKREFQFTPTPSSWVCFALCLFIALLCLSPLNRASASQSMPVIDLSGLKGIDTVIVSRSTVPEHTLLPPEDLKDHSEDFIITLVKDLFSTQPWIKFRLRSDVPFAERKKPNVLLLTYAISAQRDSHNGTVLNVGAVALQLRRHDTAGQEYAIPVVPAVYPFIVPKSREAFRTRVAEGVRYLTSYIPGYLTCANRSEASSENPCFIEHPFKERLGVPCRPPDPRPCPSME
jgi:hypothetical protein